jgi:hypothetical protein
MSPLPTSPLRKWSRRTTSRRRSSPPFEHASTFFPSVVAGIAAFGASLGSCTWGQLQLGISTGSARPIPTVLGIISVALSSYLSHYVALSTYTWQQQDGAGRVPSFWQKWQTSDCLDLRPLLYSLPGVNRNNDYPFLVLPWHPIRVAALGLLTYQVIGGQYWRVAPSSYTDPGSYALSRYSIPSAVTENYATPSQRLAIEQYGKIAGCHTCGYKQNWFSKPAALSFSFVADHMPPKSVAAQRNQSWFRRYIRRRPVSFRFFPQCTSCSNTQGGLLAKGVASGVQSLEQVGRGRQAYFHGMQPRRTWLTGGLLALMASLTLPPDTAANQVWTQNQAVYRDYHGRLQRLVLQADREVRDWWARWFA